MNNETRKRHGAWLFSLSTKLIFTTFLLIVGTCVFLSSIGTRYLDQSMETSTSQYKEAMNDGYNTEIRSEVQTSIAVIENFYDQARSGLMDEETAKKLALDTVRNMRYRDDGSGYMWIDGTDYTLIMHPILPDKEGSNRFDLTDQNGVKIIQNIMQTAQSGGGYNEFYFTKSDGVTVAPKVAYSEMFGPWGWIVTTGNYVDDMNAQIETVENHIVEEADRMNHSFFKAAIVAILFASTIALLFGWKITHGIKLVEQNLQEAAEGNLTFEIKPRLLKRADEIGAIARSLDAVKESLSDIIGNVADTGNDLKDSSERFNKKFQNITASIQDINSAVEALAQGAVQQAFDTETCNNKINELGNIVNTEKGDVTKLGDSVSSMINYSSGAVNSIHSLNEITDQTNEAVKDLYIQTEKNSKSAEDINKAVEMIKDLASQTNILSLNASIEAARAGAAGKGFAVVAEEIRRLARKSAESAEEIETVITDVTENIENSSVKMKDVTENVKKQADTLSETKDAFDHLYEEIQIVEQVTGEIGSQTETLDSLKQVVADSVNNLVSVVEENAASTEQTSASMKVLSDTINECSADTDKLFYLSQKQNEETSKFQI